MLAVIFLLIFSSIFGIISGLFLDIIQEFRPKLQPLDPGVGEAKPKKKRARIFRKIAFFNKVLISGPLGRRMTKDLAVAQVDLSPEEFFLIKELAIALLVFFLLPITTQEWMFFNMTMAFVIGYMAPEFWLKRKIRAVKNSIVRELPDLIDLLRLCVSAGLDFMLALKWIIEKTRPTKLVSEMNLVLQEINVGKPRREALNDLAKRYELPDLSTFSRTLIQADRMGTSMAEALEILSEDMRLSRYRRGEAMALKAPMKMLVPVLFFIFPVVAVLVAAPILLDFLQNNALGGVSSGLGLK